MPCFFPLQESRIKQPDADLPTHVVISATNLRRAYFSNDPFAVLRRFEPQAVVAHTMYVYRLDQGKVSSNSGTGPDAR